MKSYLILFSFFLAPIYSLACSCINGGDFCTLLPKAKEVGQLVVSGNPVRTIGHGMEFEITEVVSGTERKKRIMVWGDPGYLCRAYVTGFQREDQLLLILDKISQERTETTTGETEHVGDYELSVCGQYFVYLNGKYKTELDCYQPSTGKPTLVAVFPNPTQQSFSLIDPDIKLEEIIQVNVYLPNGQLRYSMSQMTIQALENGIEVHVEDWQNNLYFVQIRTLQDKWLAKVLVVK